MRRNFVDTPEAAGESMLSKNAAILAGLRKENQHLRSVLRWFQVAAIQACILVTSAVLTLAWAYFH